MQFRGCLHDTGATFAPARVHSGSLSHPGCCTLGTRGFSCAVSGFGQVLKSDPRFFSPLRHSCLWSSADETKLPDAREKKTSGTQGRLLYRSENFTPVRNFATVSCKSVCRWTRADSACVVCGIIMLVMGRGKTCKQVNAIRNQDSSHRGTQRLFSVKYLFEELNIAYYYTNTNEIPGELSRENLISSHVKITCYLHM